VETFLGFRRNLLLPRRTNTVFGSKMVKKLYAFSIFENASFFAAKTTKICEKIRGCMKIQTSLGLLR
jgi:hypothetical protein